MSKVTKEELAQIVDSEGLGYAVQHYLSADKIEDEELSRLWKEAGELLNKIDNILEDFMP